MDDLSKKIEDDAFKWVKSHRTVLIKKFADSSVYLPDKFPTTIFMAGSPGVGKTEVSHRLAEQFKQKPVIIDADEIRKIITGYTGKNAFLFQKAATKGVNILYDFVRDNNFNAILDGTFAYANSIENIEHSIRHNRNVEIYFLYQDPVLSWNYTKIRELKEFRNVPKNIFVKAYFKSIENVNKAKQIFEAKIKLNIMVKDFDKGLSFLKLNIQSVDSFIKKVYTVEELNKILS